jgi:hypothetical protein
LKSSSMSIVDLTWDHHSSRIIQNDNRNV